jgi:hypothetical protein
MKPLRSRLRNPQATLRIHISEYHNGDGMAAKTEHVGSAHTRPSLRQPPNTRRNAVGAALPPVAHPEGYDGTPLGARQKTRLAPSENPSKGQACPTDDSTEPQSGLL